MLERASAPSTISTARPVGNLNNREAVICFAFEENGVDADCTVLDSKDLFQIGRATENIDYTVNANQPSDNSEGQTLSRYACRILVTRGGPRQITIYAAAFDQKNRFYLGENSSKLSLDNNVTDGFTTNGVLVLRPPQFNLLEATEEELLNWEPEWEEVSVLGKMYTIPNDNRTPPTNETAASLLSNRTNEITNNTLIDLCGVTLLLKVQGSPRINIVSSVYHYFFNTLFWYNCSCCCFFLFRMKIGCVPL